MHLSWALRVPVCTSCGAGPHPTPLYPSSPLYQTVSNLQRMSMQTGSNEVGWGTADNSEDCSPLVITKGFIIPPHSWIPSVLYWTKLENLSPPEYVCNGFCLFITCFSVYLSKAAAPGHLGVTAWPYHQEAHSSREMCWQGDAWVTIIHPVFFSGITTPRCQRENAGKMKINDLSSVASRVYH